MSLQMRFLHWITRVDADHTMLPLFEPLGGTHA